MVDSARALLEDMRAYIAQIPKDQEKILPPEYVDKVNAVGEISLLVEIFREFADSELTLWMFRLGFFWKDLSFQSWKEVIRRISEELPAVYQFVWFASEALAIDVTEVIRSDPAVSGVTVSFVAQQFPKGGPLPNSRWFHEMLEEYGIDYRSMWRRLGSEGAPMRLA